MDHSTIGQVRSIAGHGSSDHRASPIDRGPAIIRPSGRCDRSRDRHHRTIGQVRSIAARPSSDHRAGAIDRGPGSSDLPGPVVDSSRGIIRPSARCDRSRARASGGAAHGPCRPGGTRYRGRKPRCRSRQPRYRSRQPRYRSRQPRCRREEPRCQSHTPRCRSPGPRCQSNTPRCSSRRRGRAMALRPFPFPFPFPILPVRLAERLQGTNTSMALGISSISSGKRPSGSPSTSRRNLSATSVLTSSILILSHRRWRTSGWPMCEPS